MVYKYRLVLRPAMTLTIAVATRAGFRWCASLLISACALSLAAQQPSIQNPHTSPADVRAGARFYRAFCAACHEFDGRGQPGHGPEIRTASPGRSTDAQLYTTIENGFPPRMPQVSFSEKERWQVVAFVQTLRQASKTVGDPAAGAALFRGKGECLGCHKVQGKGGPFGPDLSEIGALRPVEELRIAILAPNEDVSSAYWRVRAVTKDGEKVTGRRLNEDTYSVQLLDSNERLRSLMKSDLQNFEIDSNSMMPSYEGKLNEHEIDDLVAYLATLRSERTEP